MIEIKNIQESQMIGGINAIINKKKFLDTFIQRILKSTVLAIKFGYFKTPNVDAVKRITSLSL